MRISIYIGKQSDLPYIYGDRETRHIYFKKDSSSDEMKTFNYLFNRKFNVTYKPILVPIFEDYSPICCSKCDKIKSTLEKKATVKKIDYNLLSVESKKFNWKELNTEFKCNLKNLHQSTIKTLFGCSQEDKWIEFQLILEELKRDSYDISLEVNIFIEKKVNVFYEDNVERREEDLLLRFESFLSITKKELLSDDLFDRTLYASIYELFEDIENCYGYPEKYKDLLGFKIVHNKRKMKKSNKFKK